MNNELNQNWDYLYGQFLNWLTQESEAISSSEDSEESNLPPIEASSTRDGESDPLDPLDWEDDDLDMASSNFDPSTQTPQSFTMGESIVQKRFQALIKRKLHATIERNPPLFPWETEIAEYEPEYADDMPAFPVPSRAIWLPQIAALMPITIPEGVLATLLDTCTETMGFLRPQSAKMVNAVKALFPDSARILNDMAVRIRLSASFAPSRLANSDRQQQQQKLASALPKAYNEATVEQQMALSLLVAKEIIETLTIALSPRQPRLERLWQTAAGTVKLFAEYDPEAGDGQDLLSVTPLRVRVQLPKGGSLTLQAEGESITAQRTYAGYLTVELSDWQVGQLYLLEVRLADAGQMPLKFAIAWQ